MRLYNFLLSTFAALTLVGNTTVQAAETRPNIIFILVDDLRWDALSCTGHPVSKTPNIDRIGKEGAIFQNAFVTTPLCSPSRASFLTGQYVHTHGIEGNADNSKRSHELMTFPRLLKQSGYESAYVGKWHMGTDDSPRPGFDHWVGFKGQGVHVNPQINVDGKVLKKDGYMADILSDYAVEFLSRKHTKPFCLYLSHKSVHGPFTPAERHAQLYEDAPLPQAPNKKDDFDGRPALQHVKGFGEPSRKARRNSTAQKEENQGDNLARNQLRMLVAIDEGIGRMLKALEQNEELDNTLIIFTSDNGFFWGEHRLSDKRWAYEESIRIPLLMRYPKLVKAGRKIEGIALNIDIAPTLLELAGVSIPPSIEGCSLVPLLKGKSSGWRTSASLEYFKEPRYSTPTWRTIRTDDWKLIHYPDLAGMDELYHLKKDRYEMRNLIDDPRAKKELAKLKKQIGPEK